MIEGGADIQVELGNWAKVHNGILETLAKAKLDGREAKCLFFLLRMTYGKQEKQHDISLSLWAEGTDIDKRHVKPILDRLIQRRIIYRVDGKRGRGNTAIYGFNKYFEQWDNEEKVPSTVPNKKVPPTVPFIETDVEEKVPSTVPEKVPSTVPIIERKAEKAAAADPNDPMALMRLAYQTVSKFGPSTATEKGKTNLAIACDLIDRYGFMACHRMLDTLKERNAAMIRANKQGIGAPLPYLQTLMEDEQVKAICTPQSSTVNFALEELV